MTHIEDQAMYRSRARYYDAIYHWKDYAKEAHRLRELLESLGVADGSAVLEAACGSGSYLQHLQQWYTVSGFDINQPILDLASEKVPGVSLFTADLVDFEAPSPVDAALCLFSSIGYVYHEDRLTMAAASLARAVRPGGALIVEPWLAPETYRPDHRSMDTYDQPDLKLCRFVKSKLQDDLTVFDFNWLAMAAEGDVDHFVDRHVLWLCPRPTLQATFEAAGFECRYEPDGLMRERELLVGRRR